MKESVLEEAKRILGGERDNDYGDPVVNFEKIATLASLISGEEVSPEVCCIVQMSVKLARQSHKHKRDNLVDLAAYSEIFNRIKDKNIDKIEIRKAFNVNELGEQIFDSGTLKKMLKNFFKSKKTSGLTYDKSIESRLYEIYRDNDGVILGLDFCDREDRTSTKTKVVNNQKPNDV